MKKHQVNWSSGNPAFPAWEVEMAAGRILLRRNHALVNTGPRECQGWDVWGDEDPPVTTQALGSAWLKRNSSLLLKVPSAIIPSEFNYLLNPQHKDFGKLRISAPVQFRFDPRLKA